MELQNIFESKGKVEAKLRKLLTPEFIARNHKKVLDGFFTHFNEGQMIYLYDELVHEDSQEDVEFNFEVLSNWIKKAHPTWTTKYAVGPSSKRLDIKFAGGEVYVVFTQGEYSVEFESAIQGTRWKKMRVKDQTKIKPALETMFAHAAKQLDIDLD